MDRDTSLDGTPSIEEMTTVALNRLQQEEKGFFLLVCTSFILVMPWASMQYYFIPLTRVGFLTAKAKGHYLNENLTTTKIILIVSTFAD